MKDVPGRGEPLGTLPDAELVARCRSRDPDAWSELVERYSRYVWAIAVRAYGLPERDAEDVFQDVFLRVWQQLGRLRSDEAFRPWLAQLTRRLCIDRLRASRPEDPTAELPEGSAVDAELERLADALTVREALARLPENCREILDRFFVRDEPYEKLSAALGIPAGTIASRISRCRDKLRDALTDSEGTLALRA